MSRRLSLLFVLLLAGCSLNATNSKVTIGSVTTLAPGQQASLPITLNSPAPAGGVTVNLTTGNSAIATISPSTVTIAAGATSPATNPVITGGLIGQTTVSPTATGYVPVASSVNVTVNASLTSSIATKVGSSATGTLLISAAAPAGGVTFTLSSDNSAVATSTSSVTVPQGATQVSVSVSGVAPGTTTLRATSANIAETDATVVASPTMQQAIKHIVVIFDENVSFDHYFGTYPKALNPSGEPAFTAAAGTPTPANLAGTLLTANPNSQNAKNGNGATNPFRLDRAQAVTADQNHAYSAEQLAFDAGSMDLFPYSTGAADSAALASQTGAAAMASTTGLTMGYYDGNTVTALWNYAQHYALSDRFFETTFGPSTPGAINLISGQTNGVVDDGGASGTMVSDGNGGFSLLTDPDPTGDLCANASVSVHMTGKNVGDLLTAAQVSWGWFQQGFDLTAKSAANGSTGCQRYSAGLASTVHDYSPHHEPFQYYASTANPNHTRPTSVTSIGQNSDAANHQYDVSDFMAAISAGNLPAVSFVKPPSFADGHAGYSNPLDEQTFLVNMANAVEASQFWSSTAIVIAYDDSDGWYDHMLNIINASQTSEDFYASTGLCATSTATLSTTLPGVDPATTHANGRCGHGPRLPLLMISPWSRKNYIDSTPTDQTSILRMIEDIFLSGQRIGGGSYDSIAGPLDNMFDFSTPSPGNPSVLTLDPSTGVVTSTSNTTTSK